VPRWTEIGVILNRFCPEDQCRLTEEITNLGKSVNKHWATKGHKNMIVIIPPASSEYALVYVLFKNSNANLRDVFVEEAANRELQADHVSWCLVIAKNIDRGNVPAYDFIGLFNAQRQR